MRLVPGNNNRVSAVEESGGVEAMCQPGGG